MATMATTATTIPPIAPPEMPESDDSCSALLDVAATKLVDEEVLEKVVADDVSLRDVELDVVDVFGRNSRSRCSNPTVIGCAHIVIGPVAVRVVVERSVSLCLAGTVVVRPARKVLVQP